jgi:3-oxoacyl-[acyl-carrier protein] reductase
MDFTDQVVLVTGGSGGIGRAIVYALAQRHAQVLFCYHTHECAANETLHMCHDLPGEVQACQTDVRNADQVSAMVKHSLAQWGKIDALINCAGIAGYSPVSELSLEQWHAVLDTNLTGVYHTCQAVLRPMMQRRYGRIVNVAGLHGVCGFPGRADHCAAMGGVIGFTRAFAREVASWRITVNAVAPGFVETGILDNMPPAVRAWGENTIALRRSGQPEEVAMAAVFLASSHTSYITGQTLSVDGGWTMT